MVLPRRHWQFNPRLLIFSASLLPLLLALGVWQVQRAAEKEALLQQWQRQAVTLSWQELAGPGLGNEQENGLESGQPVTLTGHYDERSWLLDNRTRDGVAGYEVLTLFQPDQGPALVVNRGWLRAPASRDVLPVFPSPGGEVTIRGRLADYPEPPVLAQSDGAQGWPRRVQALHQADAAAEASTVVSKVLRLRGSDEPGAFRVDWQPDYMGPQTHYGYAVQWFSLALVLVVLTIVASYRKTGANNDNDNG
ncbi:Cytochrome oxidase assembly protein ShyY1 [Marinobacter zhejiangensis]|uniref:SURF1-like protein n=2 Tax=Marinobacter zhejiangensis TaxID=488535 RepID=A0A1I4LTU7_9GAMM|nr:Cytochrome oxidase assembly protein ShyY1 [Marinobacter zhejiangensis]